MRGGLERLAAGLRELHGSFQFKICVDTAPLLERSYARQAGLGWIGKNQCLINEQQGSWFFLGELLTSLEIAPDAPPADRCGSCTRCIDACPTAAIVPLDSTHLAERRYELDATRCISYLTIELRGPIPDELRAGIGNHVFGCDICQDVCPWNRRAPFTSEAAFEPLHLAPPLESLARMTEDDFRETFRATPVARARYEGFRRNAAIGLGNRADRDLTPREW